MQTMYRGSSPIFDVPEFPTLRRVKPLPKRRRTSDSATSHLDDRSVGRGGIMPPSLAELQLQLPGPDATAEELLAHADSLSAHLSLQSYYMPILGGVQDLFRSTLNGSGNLNVIDGDIDNPDSNAATIELGIGSGKGGGREQEEDHGEDYIDHLQQPGNTKKRKVPTNVSGSPRGHDPGSGQSGGEDETPERSVPTGRTNYDTVEVLQSYSSLGTLGQKKGKLTAATLAGLQHKELLKSRKRQLAAVLGALSHGDTLALDQALSANYPFANSGFDDLKNSEPPKVRLSRRLVPRLARAMRATQKPRHPDEIVFPECKFAFVCPSATADRLVATKKEVAMLRNRFEAELARQATKAAKLAAANKLMASLPAKGVRPKRADRGQHRTRTAGISGGKGGDQTAEFLDQVLAGMKPRGKKKKRSALANASNPHHLRNYVPSRLPHSGQNNPSQTNTNSQNDLGPLPLRFLAAEIPPRRRKKAQPAQPLPQLTNPADEWICAFCEYELFYGDEQEYRRAVRSRKKILRRRRRARERAAAAAGTSTAKAPEKSTSSHEDYDARFEPSTGDTASVPKPTKWKRETSKDIERGEQASYG